MDAAGLYNVWTHASVQDKFHFASVIGISFELWQEILSFSGLANRDGAMMYSKWGSLLKVNMTTRDRRDKTEAIRTTWFKMSPIDMTERRASRSSSHQESRSLRSSSQQIVSDVSFTPCDAVALEHLVDFYEAVDKLGLLRGDAYLNTPK